MRPDQRALERGLERGAPVDRPPGTGLEPQRAAGELGTELFDPRPPRLGALRRRAATNAVRYFLATQTAPALRLSVMQPEDLGLSAACWAKEQAEAAAVRPEAVPGPDFAPERVRAFAEADEG
jgi:hypothetical protein